MWGGEVCIHMGLHISYHNKSWMCACLLTWEKYRACAASWGPRLRIKSPISTREPEAWVIPQHLKNLNIHLCVRALIMSTQHSHLHCCNPTKKHINYINSTEHWGEVRAQRLFYMLLTINIFYTAEYFAVSKCLLFAYTFVCQEKKYPPIKVLAVSFFPLLWQPKNRNDISTAHAFIPDETNFLWEQDSTVISSKIFI